MSPTMQTFYKKRRLIQNMSIVVNVKVIHFGPETKNKERNKL